MTIIHVIDKSTLGGAQQLLQQLSIQQAKTNKTIIWSLKSNAPETRNVTWLYGIGSILKILRAIKNSERVLIHTHLFASQIIGLLIKILYRNKIKLIYHHHGHLLRKKIIEILWLKVSAKEVDAHIAGSDSLANILKKHAPTDRIHTVINAIDYKYIETQSTDEINPVDNTLFNIGFIGRLEKIKGCRYLLEAIQLIDSNQIHCFIIGAGSLRKNLEKFTTNNALSSVVTFVGYTSNPYSYMKNLDLLVIPSLSEGSSLVFFEASFLEVPVLAHDVSSLNELITHKKNGWLSPVNNPHKLAQSISYLQSHPKIRKQLCAQAKADLNSYNIQSYSKKIKEIYELL